MLPRPGKGAGALGRRRSRRTQLAIWAVGEAHRRRTQTDGRRSEVQYAPLPSRGSLHGQVAKSDAGEIPLDLPLL